MSVDTKYYLIEYFTGESTPEYDFFLGEDEYEAVDNFRNIHPKAKIQNVAKVLDMKESVYE